MKNLIVIPFLFLACISNGQWNYISAETTLPYRIEAISEDLLIGVGPNYETQRSVDGGITWESNLTDFEYSFLIDIDFVNDQIGYICGGTYFGNYRCCLLKTIDAGLTWDTISANHHAASNVHNRLSFPTENLGFLTLDGGGILKTEDGGDTFTEIVFGEAETIYTIHDVEFFNENLGFASYTETIYGELENININRLYKSIDQGITWNIVYENEISVEDFTEHQSIFTIQILDEQHIFGVGANGGFIKSTDGGESWDYSTIAPGSTTLTALQFVSPEVGFSHPAGVMHRTEDGGETWIPQTTNPLSILDDITMVDENVGYFVGSSQWTWRYLQKTTNAGGPLNIAEIPNLSVSVYPNPATDVFQIDTQDLSFVSAITLYDIAGRQVKNFNVNSNTYNISDLESGNYILKIQKGTQILTTTLIKI